MLDLLLRTEGQSAGALLLTTSEIDIITVISGGLSTMDMTSRKSVSVHTVMSRRKNIYRKLRASSKRELMIHTAEFSDDHQT